MSGVIWSGLQQFSFIFVTFFISILLARKLSPSEFGTIAMLSIFISIGHQLINSGLTMSLIRDNNSDEEDYSTVFFFNLIVSVFIYTVVYFLAPYIAVFYTKDILTDLIRVLGIVFIIQAFGSVQQSLMNKNMNFKKLTIINIPALILSGIIGIWMAYNHYGVWSLVAQSISFAIFNTLLLWYHSKWKPKLFFSISKFKNHFNFGYNILFSGILNSIFSEAYTVIIGKFFPSAQLGYYLRANSMSHLPSTSLSVLVHKVSFPLLSKIQDDDEKLTSSYRKIMQLITYVLAPTLVILAILANPLFSFLITDKWLPAVPYFQILVVNAFLYPILAFNLEILIVKGRADLFLRAEVIKKIIIAGVLLISFQYGILGLIYGSVVVSIIALFTNTYFSNQVINYSLPKQLLDILPATIFSLLVGSIIYFIDKTLLSNSLDIIRLVVSTLIFIILYLTITISAGLKAPKELLTILKIAFNKSL
ncbi:MAG: lipopolysaccharide biosynthesis protein [Saprospiraceae bacterium]